MVAVVCPDNTTGLQVLKPDRVGYDDPAYFSRDYKKLFGDPPHRDISRLRSRLELGGSVASV